MASSTQGAIRRRFIVRGESELDRTAVPVPLGYTLHSDLTLRIITHTPLRHLSRWDRAINRLLQRVVVETLWRYGGLERGLIARVLLCF